MNSTVKSFTLTSNGNTKSIAGKTVNSRPEAKLDFKPGAVSNYAIIATCGKDANGADLTVDVSAGAAWSSSNPGIAEMTAVGDVYQIGTVTDAYGLATIKASYGGKSVSLKVNSVPKDLSVSPSPGERSMTGSASAQLLSTATFAEGSTDDVTSKVSRFRPPEGMQRLSVPPVVWSQLLPKAAVWITA